MKDALGHGSGSRGGGGPYLKPNGRSIMPSRPAGASPVRTANMAHVGELRDRLAPPKGGLLHSFTSGLRDALNAGAALHAKSLNGYDPRGPR